MKYTIAIIFIYATVSGFCQNDTVDSVNFEKSMIREMESMVNMVTLKNKRITAAALPGLGYDPESAWEMGFVLGISIKPKDSISMYYRPSIISSYVSYSTNDWLRTKLDFKIYTAGGYFYKLLSRYMNTPDTFWGIGNDIVPEHSSRFKLRNLSVDFQVGKSFRNIFFVGLATEFSYVETMSVTYFVLNRSIHGYNGGFSTGCGPFVTIDTRDNVNYPYKGILFDARYLFYPHEYINDYALQSYKIEVSYFKFLFSDLILALNTSLSVTDGETPFYKMPQLAGNSYLRGISNRYKYIDKGCMYGQAEFRKHIWWRIGAAVWAGVGNTFPNLNNVTLTSPKWVYGIGARFAIAEKERLNLRADLGFGSNNDYGFYLSVSEAF